MNNLEKIYALTFVALLFTLTGCNSQSYPSPTVYSTLPTTSTPAFIIPSPTSNLPYNDNNVENEYCKEPMIQLSFTDAKDLDEDAITNNLMSLYLDYFYVADAPDYCRIDGYRIEKIEYDERMASSPLLPKSGFMRGIQFSVKLVQIPNFWMSYPSQLDQQNWLHLALPVAIYKSDTENNYTIKIALGGP